MIEHFKADDPELPGFAKYSSTFKNDDRCYEVDFIVGDDYDEVWHETIILYAAGEYADLDVNYSTEGEKYVGVTCADYERADEDS